MGVSEPYRERAEECFRLAAEAENKWIRKALEDLAFEMLEQAEELEPTGTKTPDAVLMARQRGTGRSDQDHG